MTATTARKELRNYASKEKALIQQRFFKTGPGEYGEGDIFIGVKVPEVRRVAKTYVALALSEIEKLLESKVHEERLLALLILVFKFKNADREKQKIIYDFYLQHTRYVNNWDLVDLSADKIVGEYLLERSRKPLYRLAKSPLLWERRIAIVATFAFIKRGDTADTFALIQELLSDEHDLMHKACGWMLREAGKKNEKALEKFLEELGHLMPRTMLRYSIERLPENKRKHYLKSTRVEKV